MLRQHSLQLLAAGSQQLTSLHTVTHCTAFIRIELHSLLSHTFMLLLGVPCYLSMLQAGHGRA
jgi:hypothetical protein